MGIETNVAVTERPVCAPSTTALPRQALGSCATVAMQYDDDDDYDDHDDYDDDDDGDDDDDDYYYYYYY